MKTEKFLDIDGNIIKSMGFKEGRIIGEILSDLEGLVLDDPSKNNREYLMKYIENNYRWYNDKIIWNWWSSWDCK